MDCAAAAYNGAAAAYLCAAAAYMCAAAAYNGAAAAYLLDYMRIRLNSAQFSWVWALAELGNRF